ncbi:hypothetical protein ACQ4PT_047757 [Festuca glaucescens]
MDEPRVEACGPNSTASSNPEGRRPRDRRAKPGRDQENWGKGRMATGMRRTEEWEDGGGRCWGGHGGGARVDGGRVESHWPVAGETRWMATGRRAAGGGGGSLAGGWEARCRWRGQRVGGIRSWGLSKGPARAMMADLSGKHGPGAANAIFVSWMAIGNILGYSSGSTDKWHEWFPALQTRACCEACANLKAAFLVAVIFLGFSTMVTMIFAKETPLDPEVATQSEGEATGPLAVFKGMKNLPAGMPQVLIVTGLTWLSWFPFILFDTDWMGREMYHGRPDGSPAEVAAFQEGVRQGAFGLLLNSVLLGISSFAIEPMCRKLGPRTVWVLSQGLVCIAMALVAILGSWSLGDFGGNVQDAAATEKGLKASALALFVFLGLPFAVLCSVPFAVTAQLAASKGGGQGLCTGVLNIAIVMPQMVIAIGAGPWDELFGKGNIPAFALASVFAFSSAVAGVIMLPKMPKSSFRSVSMGGGH